MGAVSVACIRTAERAATPTVTRAGQLSVLSPFLLRSIVVAMYLIAVDVGIKNLGFIVYCLKSRKVVCWERLTVSGDDKYMPQNNVAYMHALVAHYSVYFESAVKVVVEKQMRANMRIIEAILHTMFYSICDIVNAKFIKAHFNLSTPSYRQNKKAAVEFVSNFLKEPQTQVWNAEECLGKFTQSTKKDDLADAMLLLLYYLDTFTFCALPAAAGRVAEACPAADCSSQQNSSPLSTPSTSCDRPQSPRGAAAHMHSPGSSSPAAASSPP
jgi:hypothetical protein